MNDILDCQVMKREELKGEVLTPQKSKVLQLKDLNLNDLNLLNSKWENEEQLLVKSQELESLPIHKYIKELLEGKGFWIDSLLDKYIYIWENAETASPDWTIMPDWKTKMKVLDKMWEMMWISKNKKWWNDNQINLALLLKK